jgi:hypothetical protein
MKKPLTQGDRPQHLPHGWPAKLWPFALIKIALAMDMCFAAVGKAIFGHPEVVVGFVPGGGATQR